MLYIDLNCDMGEGTGNDDAIMPYISSANIACGCHAGDEAVIRKTITLALQYNVAIGAHPGFNDKENFGRLNIQLTNDEVYNLVLHQVLLIKNIAATYNTKLHHVKPHGALYNMAAKDAGMAAAIAKAVKDVDATLVLYGLNNSCLIWEAQKLQVTTANEVFADRRYNNDGSLVSRAKPGALIDDEKEAVGQVLNMVLHNTVVSVDGVNVGVQPQTICLHGDGKHAVALTKLIHQTLIANNIIVRPV